MRLFLLLLFWAMHTCLWSQGDPTRFALDPLGEGQKRISLRSSELHGGLQPFVRQLDPEWFETSDSTKTSEKKIQVNPLGSISMGLSSSDSLRAIGRVMPGVRINAYPGSRWDIGFAYQFMGAALPNYLRSFNDSLDVLPGVGFSTNDDQSAIGHYYEGHIGYQAGKYFHFEVGRGRHFWGDGYRSLILSHNAAPYPYFRMDTRIWKLKLTNLIGQFRDRLPNAPFDQNRYKYGALHTLSWNVSKMVNFSFYEMVIWQERDTLSDRGLEFNYLHPLLFFRPVEFAQGSADNVLLGFSTNVKTYTGQQIYGQVFIDEFLLKEVLLAEGWWANKIGAQIGIKSFDTFTDGLHFQLEFNTVRPFTYTHGSRVQAYGHQNQGLAHPLGTNFRELVFITRLERPKWTFLLSAVAGEYGRDRQDENFGGNLFASYVNPEKERFNFIGQGVHHALWIQRLEVMRKLDHNLELFADLMLRSEFVDGKSFTEQMVLFGLRTPMIRNYRDF